MRGVALWLYRAMAGTLAMFLVVGAPWLARRRYALVRGEVARAVAKTPRGWDRGGRLTTALVCAEDHRFAHHAGIDPVAVCRAVYRLLSRGRIEGASTIEQQCVRVASRDYRRCLSRKLTEMVMACRLSREFGKREIAAAYLRLAYFGAGMQGLDQALAVLCPLGVADAAQAARVAARLKYPQPRDPHPVLAAKIAVRERHVASLCRRWSPMIQAALDDRAGRRPSLEGRQAAMVPSGPGRLDAIRLGASPEEAAASCVREAVDWSRVAFFAPAEWGPLADRVHAGVVYALDRARGQVGRPCVIHAAFARSGHVPGSYHFLGRAVDFHFSGPGGLEEEFCALAEAGFTGIGWYPFWSPRPGWHADTRQSPAYWIGMHGTYALHATPGRLLSAARRIQDARVRPGGLQHGGPKPPGLTPETWPAPGV